MLLGNLLKKKSKRPASSVGKNSLRSPEVLGVNLVKDEIVVLFDWNKHIFLSIIVFIVVGLFVFEIYAGLGYWEKQENERAEELRSKTDILKLEVLNLNSEHAAALTFRDKSGAFAELLENHVYWSKFFDWLQKNTLNTVSYQGFSGDLTGVYELSATAPSYAEASWQAKVFAESKIVKSVKIGSVSSGGGDDDTASALPISEQESEGKLVVGSVAFTIQLEISPEIFRVTE